MLPFNGFFTKSGHRILIGILPYSKYYLRKCYNFSGHPYRREKAKERADSPTGTFESLPKESQGGE